MKANSRTKNALIIFISIFLVAIIVFLCIITFSGCDNTTAEPYNSAVKDGYTGTVDDFVISLVEETVLNNNSSYIQANGKGYYGSYNEWLCLFVNGNYKPSSAKKSVYNLALENGFVGTEDQWNKCFTKSARTTDKVGSSAYQRCVESGFQGSRAEFMDIVSQSNGQLYSLARKHLYLGSYVDWMAGLLDSSNSYCSTYESTFSFVKYFYGDITLLDWIVSVVPKDSIKNKGVLIYTEAVEAGYDDRYNYWFDRVVCHSAFNKIKDFGYKGTQKELANAVNLSVNIKQLQDIIKQDGYFGSESELVAILAQKTVSTTIEVAKKNGYKGTESQLFFDACAAVNEKKLSDPRRTRGLSKAYVGSNNHLIAVVGGEKIDLGKVNGSYKPNKKLFTVRFLDYNSAVLSVQVVVMGDSAKAPITPTRTGYMFSGWSENYEHIKSNLTVIAKYKKSKNPTLIVDSISASAGDKSLQLAVSVKNNPGVLGMQLALDYDENVLILKSVKNGSAVSDVLTFTKPNALNSGCNLCWDGVEIKENQIKDGDIAILTFDISDNSPVGNYPISVSYREGDIVDNNLKTITFETVSGGIKVIK